MSRRVTARIMARELYNAASKPNTSKTTWVEPPPILMPLNIDAHSSGAKFDAPAKPKAKAKKANIK